MRHRNPPLESVLSAFAPYIVGGIGLWILYRKLNVGTKIDEIKKSADEVRKNLPGAAKYEATRALKFAIDPFGLILKRDKYVSQDEARARDAATRARLAARRG